VLIQLGLHKAMKENIFNMKSEKLEELDFNATSAIHMYLAKNILANDHDSSLANELWKKLEGLYHTNDISNQLFVKE